MSALDSEKLPTFPDPKNSVLLDRGRLRHGPWYDRYAIHTGTFESLRWSASSARNARPGGPQADPSSTSPFITDSFAATAAASSKRSTRLAEASIAMKSRACGEAWEAAVHGSWIRRSWAVAKNRLLKSCSGRRQELQT